MFQSFEEIGSPGAVPERVRALRRELKSRKLKGFLVPHSDEHQDEFLPPCAERLRWLTGFSGSAGAAIVLENAAALFVDGRYTLQARAQTDISLFDVLQTPDAKASKWLAAALPKGGTHRLRPEPPHHQRDRAPDRGSGQGRHSLAAAGLTIRSTCYGRTALPLPPLPWFRMVPKSQAGVRFEKIAEVQETLKREKADAVLLTLLDFDRLAVQHPRWAISPTPRSRLRFALVPARGRASALHRSAELGDNVRGHLKETAELLPAGGARRTTESAWREECARPPRPETTRVRFAHILEAAGAEIRRRRRYP